MKLFFYVLCFMGFFPASTVRLVYEEIILCIRLVVMVFECDSYRYSSLAMKQEERQGRKIKSQHWTNVFLPTTARLVIYRN